MPRVLLLLLLILEERVPCDIKNVDIDVEVVEGAIQYRTKCCVSLLLNVFDYRSLNLSSHLLIGKMV